LTIAIGLLVGDGVVLGADSASTLVAGGGVLNVYFNAEKIVNLRKGLPVGMVTYGLGGLQGRSTTSHSKDLRRRLTDENDAWFLKPGAYTVEEVAHRVREYFFDDLYQKDFSGATTFQPMGFMVAGFSAGSPQPELWLVEVASDGTCSGPDRQVAMLVWKGQPDAINRLIMGTTDAAIGRAVAAGVPLADAMQLMVEEAALAHPAMPVQDAIALVHFLAKVTCGFVKFGPGPSTVAGPIDSAVITKHEHFKWVRRKHYYRQALNPPQHWNDSSSSN
jgi:hypothetical protein